MNRIVLIAVSVAAVLVLGGVLAWRFLGSSFGGERGVASIVIVTDRMLGNVADAQSQAFARDLYIMVQQRASDVQGALGSGAQAGGRGNREQATAASNDAASSPAAAAPEESAEMLRDLLSDQMEAQLNGYLTRSGRFKVRDPTSLRTVLQQMSLEAARARSQAAKGEEAATKEGKSVVSAAVAEVRQGLQQITTSSQDGGTVTATEALSATDLAQNSDLASAADKLGVDYFLYISLEQPHFTKTSNAERTRIEADPVFVYRLYDVKSRKTLISDAAQIEAPMAVEVPWSLIRSEAGGNLRDWVQTYVAHIARAGQEAGLELQRAIASMVTSRVLDEVFPASIARFDPMTITRGTNDNVAVGDVVQVIRLDRANAIREGGAVIDVPEAVVGMAQVVSVQANTSVIRPGTGVVVEAARLSDYIVRRADAEEGGGPSGTGGYRGRGPGLGVADIASQGETDTIAASVAVGDLRIYSDPAAIRENFNVGMLQSAIAGKLAEDRRITVLSREALHQLRQEQEIPTGDARRRSYRASNFGFARAGFLVLGDVTVETRRHARTVRVAGAPPREVSASYEMVANARLRIEALDSRLIGSFDVAARTPIASAAAATTPEASRALGEAFAAAAAEKILPRLFPIQIASVDGGAIILTRGADVGLQVGDRLSIYAIGRPVIDPTTKRQISPGARRKVGEVRIDDVQPTVSTASVIGSFTPVVGNVAERDAAAPDREPARRSSSRASEPAQEEAKVPW